MLNSLVTTVVTPSKWARPRCAPSSVSVRPGHGHRRGKALADRAPRPAARTGSRPRHRGGASSRCSSRGYASRSRGSLNWAGLTNSDTTTTSHSLARAPQQRQVTVVQAAHRRHQADHLPARRARRGRREPREWCGASSCRHRLLRGQRCAWRDQGVEQREQLGRPLAIARVGAHRLFIPAGHGPGQGALAPGRPSSRPWPGRAAPAARRLHPAPLGQPLGRGLERDQEVRGDRCGGVVERAILVGDPRPAASRALRPAAARAPARVGVSPSIAAPAPANAAPVAVTVISGWSENASWGASGSSPVAPEQ